MSRRFPIWPPQRLPTARLADWTAYGVALDTLSGDGGFSLYKDNVNTTTWAGYYQAIVDPAAVPFVVIRAGGVGPTFTSGMYAAVQLVGANKSVGWELVNVDRWRYFLHDTSALPPGASSELSAGTAPVPFQAVPNFVGLWIDRTVSPARVRPMWGMDCLPPLTVGGPPDGMNVRNNGTADPALSGGGGLDIGALQRWAVGFAVTSTGKYGQRLTVFEASQGTFASSGAGLAGDPALLAGARSALVGPRRGLAGAV